MAHKVNPPPQLRIPDKFFSDPEIRSFFERQNYIIFQLWNRTGGPDDIISGLEATSEYNEVSIPAISDDFASEINANENYLPSLDEEFTGSVEQTVVVKPEFRSISVNTSTDAIAFDFIAVTASAVIALPQYPDSDDIVTVLNVNGDKVTVDGNGMLINGESTTISYKKNTTINYHYFADLGAWYMK